MNFVAQPTVARQISFFRNWVHCGLEFGPDLQTNYYLLQWRNLPLHVRTRVTLPRKFPLPPFHLFIYRSARNQQSSAKFSFLPHDQNSLSLVLGIHLLKFDGLLIDAEDSAADGVGLSVRPASRFFLLDNLLSVLERTLSKVISLDSATIYNGAEESGRVLNNLIL